MSTSLGKSDLERSGKSPAVPDGMPGSTLRDLARREATRLRYANGLSVAAALIWPLQAALVAYALGTVLEGGAAPLPVVVGGYLALGILRAVLGHSADRSAQTAAQRIVADLRHEILAGEQHRLAPGAFGGAGAVAALTVEKLDVLVPFLTRFAPARARVAAVPIVILALTFWLSWAAGLVLLVTGPLIPVFMALVGLAAKEASARQMVEIGSLNDLLVERLSALVDIRVLGAAGTVAQDFVRRSGDLRQRTMAVLRLAFLSSTVLELFAAIGVAMVAVYVGFSLLGQLGFGAWGSPLAPMAGIFILLLAPDYYQPLRDLAASWHDKAAADAVADEVARWRQDQTDLLPGQGARVAPLAGPASVSLAGCRMAGGDLLPDLTISEGEAVALVGPSGSGKTTLLRLMAGLSLPSEGKVTVAGQALTGENADAWRARLGWMPQEAHFLSTSLAANIRMGRPGDIRGALTTAAAVDIAEALPQGLVTRLGESGGGLSGGEARRMTLARAIFSAPDIVLADEPTANLDAATAGAVTDGLIRQRQRGATLVVATHDMGLAGRMDRIIYLGGAG